MLKSNLKFADWQVHFETKLVILMHFSKNDHVFIHRYSGWSSLLSCVEILPRVTKRTDFWIVFFENMHHRSYWRRFCILHFFIFATSKNPTIFRNILNAVKSCVRMTVCFIQDRGMPWARIFACVTNTSCEELVFAYSGNMCLFYAKKFHLFCVQTQLLNMFLHKYYSPAEEVKHKLTKRFAWFRNRSIIDSRTLLGFVAVYLFVALAAQYKLFSNCGMKFA